MSTDLPIVAALSGGVDSATAAAMLVDQGHRVIGITMRLYDARGTAASAGGRCCGPRDIEDARRVCHHLGIPFYVVDFAEEFARTVVDDFVDAYLRGETPNPCVRCNQHIKFTPLLRRARALGADRIATGHYARIAAGDGGLLRLRRGVDPGKDQSYFLFSMPVEELGSVMFPLGDLDKDEVRRRAVAYGLPNAAKPESQEICFVPDGDYAGFVRAAAVRRGKPVPPAGAVVDETGAEVGRHDGIHQFTVGQRRGLGGIGAALGHPVYVSRIDPATHQVVVGDDRAARSRQIAVGDVRWFGPAPRGAVSAMVQVRHRARPIAATIETCDDDRARVSFGEPTIAAPGQAAVFYDGDVVLGGGWVQPAVS